MTILSQDFVVCLGMACVANVYRHFRGKSEGVWVPGNAVNRRTSGDRFVINPTRAVILVAELLTKLAQM
jgi:hypothetical protein